MKIASASSIAWAMVVVGAAACSKPTPVNPESTAAPVESVSAAPSGAAPEVATVAPTAEASTQPSVEASAVPSSAPALSATAVASAAASAPAAGAALTKCTDECVKKSQMKAVSIKQIESDCRKGCEANKPK